ncbi:Anucleate primary sterigmata protein B [Xylographa soralifera]|nr:Anucleate primary sterigmata protein B [Xylographa soralifera]
MASSPLRPNLSRQHSRVPGGFDTDDDISPIKVEFDDVGTDSKHERDPIITDGADQNNKRVNISNEDGGSLMPGNDSIVDEKEMAKKLMDVESSFMPELSPVGSSGAPSTMDKKRNLEPIPSLASAGGSYVSSDPEENHEPPSTPPEFYQTPAPGREGLSLYQSSPETSADHANTSSLETMSSSPTAAAAARTVSRVISLASIGGYETAEEESPSKNFGEENEQSDGRDVTPRNQQITSRISSRAGSPTPTKLRNSEDTEEAANGDIDEDESDLLQNPKRRPKFLNGRYGSQRSSYSSYTSRTTTSTEAASDLTVGAEYALQTGGAVPFGSSTASRNQPELSRSISLGSMASGISALSDGDDRQRLSNNALDGLGSLLEEESSSLTNQALPLEEASSPHTPRTASTFSESVSKTVVGHRMRPNETQSIARGHRDKSNASSPERRIAIPTPATGRGKNLTLKEQSSTIDKLQKENWDLKLKIQFMSNLINQRSEEGVNSIMSENVELRTDKYKAAQEIRKQKRLVRELEFKLREMEESKAARTRDQVMDQRQSRDGAATQELQTEVTFLRERSETYEIEIEKLRQEGASKDGEKRRLAEVVKSMSERRAGGSDIGVREEVDMWKDLLETETARREQSDEDNKQLRKELWRMKADAASTISYNQSGNGYNTASRHHVSSGTTQVNSYVQDAERNGVASAASSTLVEQLRHENDELRREVGAQTSMLTSRNREKERLYQEIEDLKMGQRRGAGSRSVTGDSIFERSASRAHRRSASRTSEATRVTQMSDAERETLETINGELRDQMSELKLSNQDLVAQMEGLLDELAEFDVTKKDFQKLEQMHEALLEQMEQTTQDILTMQKERDEALELHEDAESSFKDLEDEAQQRISSLRAEIDEKTELLQRLESELASRDEESDTLRNEVRMLSEGLNRVEAEVQTKIRRIQEVELENEDINRELETLEKSLLEVNGKNEKLFIELESRQGECAFLREEQDGCMIKIGDLESAIKTVQSNLNSEKDHNKDLETRLAEERHQREVIGSKEKHEVQKMMNDLNRELSSAKDEIRELKKSLESCETELAAWKGSFMDIESSLREVLGDPTGSKATFISTISQLQKDLESTSTSLDSARHSLSEKERLLHRRDALLESHGLESKKLSELLEKERAGRRADKVQHEQWQKSHQHTSRTVSQKDTRITELEAARQADRKKLAAMEQEYKDQLLERNNLLLAVWHRLASICGKDWQHQNSLVSGHLPTVEVVSGMLPGFSKNLISAVKTVEGLMSGFRSRIRGIERDLMKDFQALEHNLDMRIKRLDRLESAVQVSRVSSAASAAPEIAKLRGENRMLKAELGVFHKQDMHSRASRLDSKNSSSERGVSGSRGPLPAGLVRHHSSSAVEVRSGEGPEIPQAYSQPIEPSQQRWIHRLKELERRLKAEREARLLDRSGARKRLEEERAAAEELRRELEREKVRWGQ